MVFSKKLIGLSLLSTLFSSMYAMESTPGIQKLKESQAKQPDQAPQTTPIQIPILQNLANSAPGIQAAKQATSQQDYATPTTAPQNAPQSTHQSKKDSTPQVVPATEQVTFDPEIIKQIDQIVQGETQVGTIKVTPINYPDAFNIESPFRIQGEIVPSLQQSDTYCGYYALFNASLMLRLNGLA